MRLHQASSCHNSGSLQRLKHLKRVTARHTGRDRSDPILVWNRHDDERAIVSREENRIIVERRLVIKDRARHEPKRVVIDDLHHQHGTGERVATRQESESRCDLTGQPIEGNAVPRQRFQGLQTQHHRRRRSDAFESESFGCRLTFDAELLGQGALLDRIRYPPHRDRRRAEMWASLLQPRGCRGQSSRVDLIAHLLRSPRCGTDDSICIGASLRPKKPLGPIAQVTGIGALKHEEEPTEARGVISATLLKGFSTNPEPICRVEIDPSNIPDAPGKPCIIKV